MKIKEIELKKLKSNPKQPRIRFYKEDLEELGDSIKKHGLLQPIIATEVEG